MQQKEVQIWCKKLIKFDLTVLIGETREDIFGCFDLKVGLCLREGYVGSWAHTSSLPCGRSEGGLPATRNKGPHSLPQGPLKDRRP